MIPLTVEYAVCYGMKSVPRRCAANRCRQIFHRTLQSRLVATAVGDRPKNACKIAYFAPLSRRELTPLMKLPVPIRSAFDLNASKPRIWPLASQRGDRSMRDGGYGEAGLPPGGARLASILCQRFGRPSQAQPRPGSRLRVECCQGVRCTAKHP